MILHIAADSSSHIIYPFIKFVNQHFNKNEHFFILCSVKKDIKQFDNAITKDIFTQEEFFVKQMKNANKIILHGIWYDKLCEIYKKYPEFFEKTIWNAWGGDYYFIRSYIHKWFIENTKYILINKNEIKILKNLYKTNAKFFIQEMYLIQSLKKFRKKKNKTLKILINHSGNENNLHLGLLNKIKSLKNKNVKIYLPLAYGNQNYIKKVKKKYKNYFKGKCIILTKKMPINKYLNFLSQIDIAIFNHTIQSGRNTKIFLFANQTKIYVNPNDNLIKEYKDLNLKFFLNNKISLKKEHLYQNYIKIKKAFSKEKVKKNLKFCFEEII